MSDLTNECMTQAEEKINYQILFESLPGPYLILSPCLIILTMSDAYASATMTQRSDVVGRHLFEVFPDNPDDNTADGVSNLRASLAAVLSTKATHAMAVQKYDIRRPDGTFEERYWSPVNKPVLSAQNEVVYIIHRVEDVTDFVRIQRAQAAKDKIADDLLLKTQAMDAEIYARSQEIQKLNMELESKVAERTAEIESVSRDIADYKYALDESSIVAVTDAQGVILHANDNFCRIARYTRDELIGQDHRIISSGYHPKSYIRGLWSTISRGNIWKGELKNKAKDGTVYWVDTTIVPFMDETGRPSKYLAIRSDITERKLAEEKILELNADLENKITERTLELTQSLEREQAMNSMKSRFVSMASHEFRTPLSTIMSSIALVDTYKSDDQIEKREKHIERIKSSVRNLTGILNDFLSLEKLEQGKVEIQNEPFDLREYAGDIVEDLHGMLKSGQVILYSYTGQSEFCSDKKVLKNVMLNLLSNAVKYSPENKEITLSIDNSIDRVLISVKDNGIGIPEDEQKNLFGQFFRARNAETIQGTGLGLNIVKRYIELLDGTISFISCSGEGTTFTVSLPHAEVKIEKQEDVVSSADYSDV